MKTPELKHEVFTLHSNLLGGETPYYAIFPQNFGMSQSKCFPVLYLLHGLFGQFDNWITNTNILSYAAKLPLVIICPEGRDGWYADNPARAHHAYESYFFNELFPAVEHRFKLAGQRSSRAIAGLSMGGYGAFKFALRRPEMFCFAAAMSGAFHAAEIRAGDGWQELQPSLRLAFGDADNSNSAILRARNDVFQLIESFPAEHINQLPFFYFDCGAEDSFLPVNLRLAETLRRYDIPYEFKAFPGGHDWNYWNARLENILQMAAKFMH